MRAKPAGSSGSAQSKAASGAHQVDAAAADNTADQANPAAVGGAGGPAPPIGQPNQIDSEPADQATQDQSRSRPAELAVLDRLRLQGRKPGPPKPASPAEWSSARDPKLLKELVEEVVQREGWADQLSVADLVVRWDQLVGAVNAEHCQPIGFDQGVLTVQADSSAWASAIRLSLATLQERIDQAVGEGLVHQIKVRGPAGPPGARGRWRVKGRAT